MSEDADQYQNLSSIADAWSDWFDWIWQHEPFANQKESKKFGFNKMIIFRVLDLLYIALVLHGVNYSFGLIYMCSTGVCVVAPLKGF